jgi:hypothetical protein
LVAISFFFVAVFFSAFFAASFVALFTDFPPSPISLPFSPSPPKRLAKPPILLFPLVNLLFADWEDVSEKHAGVIS